MLSIFSYLNKRMQSTLYIVIHKVKLLIIKSLNHQLWRTRKNILSTRKNKQNQKKKEERKIKGYLI